MRFVCVTILRVEGKCIHCLKQRPIVTGNESNEWKMEDSDVCGRIIEEGISVWTGLNSWRDGPLVKAVRNFGLRRS